MNTFSSLCALFFCFMLFTACQGDERPTSAKEAREMLVGKHWSVKDAGLLESSFRANKGEPFTHTFQWLHSAQNLSAESRESLAKFMKVTLVLDENKTPNDDSGNIAHLTGLDLQEKQGYYFTATQEENANDRTVKLYVVSIYPDGRIDKFPFTILEGTGNKIVLAAPNEIQPRNLVLSLEAH